MRLIFTLLSDLLKFGEKKLTVLALLAFSGILSVDSMYVPSEPDPGFYHGYSPLVKLVVLTIYGTEAFCIFLLCARWKTAARPLLRDPFLLILISMAVASFAWSDFPKDSLMRGITTIQTAIVGLYMASRYRLKEQVRLVGWTMGIMAVFSFLYTLALPGYGKETGMHAPAWRGPYAHKNPFAQMMTLASVTLLLLAMDSPKKYRFQLWTIFGMAIILVLMSTSKTGLLITLNLILLVPFYQALRWSDGIMIPVIIFVLLVVGCGTTFLLAYWEPVLYGLGKDPTLSGRTDVWEIAIYQILKRPLLGYGYQAYWRNDGAAFFLRKQVNYDAAHAHNGFINIGLDLGLLGIALFSLSIITTFIRGVTMMRLTRSSLDLWPLMYMSYLIFYNQTESAIIAHNSLLFVLHVATSFSVGFARKLSPREVRRRKQELKEKQDLYQLTRPP